MLHTLCYSNIELPDDSIVNPTTKFIGLTVHCYSHKMFNIFCSIVHNEPYSNPTPDLAMIHWVEGDGKYTQVVFLPTLKKRHFHKLYHPCCSSMLNALHHYVFLE